MADRTLEPRISDAAGTAARPRTADLDELIRINTDDLLTAFGLAGLRRGRAAVGRIFRAPARRFALEAKRFDDIVGTAGLGAGGAWALERFVAGVEIRGRERVPLTGPLLLLSNHPGLTDTLALFAATPRSDLRIIAADRPFLRALPHTSEYLLTLAEGAGPQLGLLRATARHLRGGGAVLTFPGGRIEPDPAVLPGAAEALEAWAPSTDALARLAEGVAVQPVIVSGVLSAAALRHPLTRIRRSRRDREWLGATLQLLRRRLGRVTVTVSFGEPFRAADLPAGTGVRREAISRARSLVGEAAPASARG